MKRKAITMLLFCFSIVCLCACSQWGSPTSSFSILFMDVGQGDAALVECDGRYMLIDGGDASAGGKVYSTLEEQGIQHLDILAISHMDADHIGGLPRALSYASDIDLTIANTSEWPTESFRKLEHELSINGTEITVPQIHKTYQLGNAEVEVVDVASSAENDSLVLLIAYGNTRFLFTGDIEYKAQKRVAEYLSSDQRTDQSGVFKIDCVKMPHHGAYNDNLGFQNSNLNRLIMTISPDYAVISVGNGNRYDHPHHDTMELLEQADVKVYRTDEDGDVLVHSDGKTLSIQTSK